MIMRPDEPTSMLVRRERVTARVSDTVNGTRKLPTYTRVLAHLQRLAPLYSAPDTNTLLERAVEAAAELVDVAHARACAVDPVDGGHRVLFERRGAHAFLPGGVNERLEPALEELARWACTSRRTLFMDAADGTELFAESLQAASEEDESEDETITIRDHRARITLDAATVRLAELTRANVVCVLPLAGASGPLGALLLWIREPGLVSRVLETELLQSLSAGLSSRAEALATTQRLRQLSSLFDNILESVPHGILALSLDGRVMALNANAEFLFDLKRVFVLDEPFQRALPARLAGELRAMTDRLLVSPGVETQLELKLAAGTSVQLGISGSWLTDRTGQRQGYLFLCRDLSLSLEVQKLREVDRLKTEFVNTVSHELKTPLTAILGGIEIIQSEPDSVREDLRELVDVVASSAEELRDLIHDLLNLARLESGRAVLKETPIDIAEFLHARVRALAPHPLHQVVVEVQPGLPRLMLDREKLQQAVGNYLSNAIKYSPDGGRVTLKAFECEGRLCIAVSDQGLGIAPEHHARIWEKFYRVDASFTTEIEGTGLGLVIVKRIVELHGGEVFVESRPGAGSTFGMRLPLRPVVNTDSQS